MIPFLLLITSISTLLFMFLAALQRRSLASRISHSRSLTHHSEVFDLMERYRFFQGKNLETFSTLLSDNNLVGIEQLIREKFEAQGIAAAAEKAKLLLEKLKS